MTNSSIPRKYKDEYKKEVLVKKFSIIGAGSIIYPGVVLEEGTAVGTMSLILKSTKPWGIYVGSPAKKLKNRKKDLIKLSEEYLKEVSKNDTI